MERKIKISQFRNIGIDEPQSILLNSNYSKGRSGNLIVVIGGNNSGKSNVLDAILKLRHNDSIGERDQTTLSYDNEFRHPSVSLSYRDENYHVEYIKELNSDGNWKVVSGDFSIKPPSRDQMKSDFVMIKNEIARYGYSINLIEDFIVSLSDSNVKDEDLIKALSATLKNTKNALNRNLGSGVWQVIINANLSTIKYWLETTGSNAEVIESKIKEITDLPALPTIHVYEEKMLKSSDLIVNNVDSIQNSIFFKSLFNILNIKPEEILNAYSHYRKHPNSAIFNKLKTIYNSKLNELNEQFNKMYCTSSDNKYKFTLDFDANNVSFGLARGKDGDDITLEYQSTGFRWFFNLFFNFLSTNVLKAGDIVVMDEPATHLHPDGQKELRRFIKDFAIRSDILFVIATQSPFLVDPDNYEELRVVSMNNNRSKVINSFTAVNIDDPDSLVPIKEALTIRQNVIYDIDTTIVWVEGITDYIYLSFFKKELGFDKIAFIPFNGVGNNKNQTKDILSRLLKIKFMKRELLIDGDKAGNDMYEQASKSDFADRVYRISDLEIGEKKPMMIEDLFSKQDKKKFTFIAEKNSHKAADLKLYSSIDDFSEETINNFKALFSLLTE